MLRPVPPDAFENEHDDPTPWWQRILRGAVALVAIVGMLYLFGGQQYFQFRRTPESVSQAPLSPKLAAEEITIPVQIIVLRSTEPRGSARTRDDAARLAANAVNIWRQANITLELRDIQEVSLSNSELQTITQEPRQYITSLPEYNLQQVNVVLIGVIGGSINGLAFIGTNSTTVADYTSSPDFRTLAHEVGHLLGLGHVPQRSRLMSPGATGVELSLDEIIRARTVAEGFARN